MKPTDTLRAEHRNILRILGCLEVTANAIRESNVVDVGDLRAMARFCREYADKCHHAKEESHLFPFLEKRGMPHQHGPIAVMLHEHEQGRAAVGAMLAAVESDSPDPDALRAFMRAADTFVSLLREHIGKEDHILFPMADDVLSADDQAELECIFEQIDQHEIGEATHREFETLARELGEKYGVPGSSNECNRPLCMGV